MVPRRALAGLGGVADQHDELVGVVAGGFDGHVRTPADHGAGGHQELGEDGHGIGLGVRGDSLDHHAGESLVGSRRWWLGPARRRGQLGLCESGQAHSPVSSATAARAEDSSTMALDAAKAATSDCTARLLTARGRPLDAWWMRASASSENKVSLRPARAR